MSGHRITAIIAFALCTSGAFANDGIDLSLYSEPWPVNYFSRTTGGAILFGDDPVATELPKCDWDENTAIPHRFAQHIAGVEEENYEGLAPMWLRGATGYGGHFEVMKCAGTIPDYKKDEPAFFEAITGLSDEELYDSFTPEWVKYKPIRIPACGKMGVAYTAEPQRHLGDTTGYAYWRCGADGNWVKEDYAMQCGQYPIDTSNETRKYLLQTETGWGAVCGPHPDDKTEMTVSNLLGTDRTPRTPRWVTVNGQACGHGMEFVVLNPNPHLQDTSGHRIWRCECHGNNCEWKIKRNIPRCTVDTIPPVGQNNQWAAPMYATGPSGSVSMEIIVNKEAVAGRFVGTTNKPTGYSHMVDKNPNDGIVFPETICYTSICAQEFGGDKFHPNRDNSGCIKYNPCMRGGAKYAIGHSYSWPCLSNDLPLSSIYKRPSKSSFPLLAVPIATDGGSKCQYLCTEHGWLIHLNEDSCAAGYVMSSDRYNCIPETTVYQKYCENSGGTWENGECKCGKNLRLSEDREYCECKSNSKLWCVSDGVGSCQGSSGNNCFDINELSNEWERALRQVSQGAVSDNFVSNATDDAANNDAETISDLAKTLDEIEDAYGLSKWRTVDGKFNYARLASDATAAVVLGTTGALVTSSVVKKQQVEAGFESLECTVGGQHVGDWGDVFRIDGK